jgi:hypothetical protein
MTRARFVFTSQGLTILFLVGVAVAVLVNAVPRSWAPTAIVVVATIGGVTINFLYDRRYGDTRDGNAE